MDERWKGEIYLIEKCFSSHTYTRLENSPTIHRRAAVPITRNKCELIKGRKQLLANKSQPLIRYSADKLNFSSRQFSRARLLRGIGICETSGRVRIIGFEHRHLRPEVEAGRTVMAGEREAWVRQTKWIIRFAEIALKRLCLFRYT